MIIKIFSNSGSAIGAVNYVLSDKDYTGKNRSVKPVILKGDEYTTKKIDEHLCSKFAHKSISGVISFRDDEDLTDKQKLKLINDFEKSFFGNMREKTNSFFCEHRDKSNLEIHFVINRVCTDGPQTGKSYNPFPPGQMSQDFKDSFVALKNEEFGFKQIETNKLKTKFTAEEYKALFLEKSGFKQLDKKHKIDMAVKDLVKKGVVTNRNQLVDFLQNEIGLNVTRKGDDYISIKTNEGLNIRLKGGFYSLNDGKNYEEVKQEHKDRKPEFNAEKTLQTFERILNARNQYNEKRYLAPATSKTPSFRSRQVQHQEQGPTTPLPMRENSPQAPSSQPIQEIQQGNSSDSGNSSQSSDDTTGRTTTDTASTVSLAGVIGAQSSFDKAISQLANAKTPEQTARAHIAVAIAKNALNNALAQIEEQKRQQSIKRKF